MGAYGDVAKKAVSLIGSKKYSSPIEAWKAAADERFGVKSFSAGKGCPRYTFLALCEEGFVKGIVRGDYTKSKKNKDYALRAIEILKTSNIDNANILWQIVMNGDKKQHNCQMDVVLGLFKSGLIKL